MAFLLFVSSFSFGQQIQKKMKMIIENNIDKILRLFLCININISLSLELVVHELVLF